MADITMCSGIGCRVKDKCYRFTAVRCEFQDVWENPPLEVKDDVLVCEMFWGECKSKVIEEIFNYGK